MADSSGNERSIDRWFISLIGFGSICPLATIIALLSDLDAWAIGAYIFLVHLVCPYAAILGLIASKRVKTPRKRVLCLAFAGLNLLILATVVTLIFVGAATL